MLGLPVWLNILVGCFQLVPTDDGHLETVSFHHNPY